MNSIEKAVRSKTTIGDVVLIVFILLKLIGLIDWSWWWVTCPLWGAFALAFVVAIIAKLEEES